MSGETGPGRAPAPAQPAAGGTGGDGPAPRVARPWLWATWLVLPFLFLAVAWSMSNPPGAAPDEPDHYVKALGVARFHIGAPYDGPPWGPSKVQSRNASIARVVTIPASLAPVPVDCFAFKSRQPANCVPAPSTAPGVVHYVTPVGAYPPFLYLLPGTAALAAQDPGDAMRAGRLVVLVMSLALLWLAARHLVHWVGHAAVLPIVVAMVPMSVFTMAIVSTSGVEVTGALALGAVLAVALVRPESVLARSTHVTTAIAGAMLILSRQLGIVSAAVFLGLTLVFVGWPTVRSLLGRWRTSVAVMVLVLAAACAATILWEIRYDHPNQIGPVFAPGAWPSFVFSAFFIFQTAVGKFGWLDTPLPGWALAAWTILAATVVGMGLVLGRARQRLVVVLVAAITVVVAYVTFATVFYSVDSGLQGRHVLPLFSGAIVVGAVAAAVRLEKARLGRELAGLVVGAGLVMGMVQFAALYANGHRYAVGILGDWWYLPTAQWTPVGGWGIWLGLGLVGAALLLLVTVTAARRIAGRKELVADVA